uniref:ATP synthase complex subunit 8 n=1 Tax=Acanthaspis cincticrus TaxID=1911546 RepID=A0A343W8Q3_9HEMI|nr:ATP synthase F0 subunit 8 [Acanthaspis cincticrus]AVZ00743.1 ATP synthase F0 subunit 8 [Acanthaspis cincticrus]
MPQMAPLWWTTLFLMFILSFIMIWTMMYFLYFSDPAEFSQEKKIETQMNWKW